MLTLLSPVFAMKNPDVCDIIDLPSCSGVSKQNRRTSNYSLPSPATAANLNPANVSVDRGFGGEVLLQANNPVAFNLVGGSGKFGGALISPTLENSFFGVRVPELNENFLERNQDQKRFDTKKLNFALAGRIIRQKNYGLDFGLLFKRHSEVKKIRTGFGLSGKLWFLTFGGSYYKDDFWLDFKHTKMGTTGIPYSVVTGTNSYSESFQVKTASVGIKVKNFSFDYGKIITDKYTYTKEKVDITLLSASMAWGNFLFNYGARTENSPAIPKFKDDMLVSSKTKKATYAGIQYSWWRPLVVGVHYNYFLLNEVSATMTFFIR
ncbi:MAG: hypothetical protein ACJ76H_10870 [Bacteriovoracaceae bacterium]